MKIPLEERWLENTIGYLELLLAILEREAMPTMIYDGDQQDLAEEIRTLIKYLNKTN
jgi:hypothetical protein